MSNQQLIKSAHIWFLTALVLCGLVAIAGKAGIRSQDPQNSNQNSNSNSSNSNTSNANSTQNRNANKSANKNTGATGEQAGMAGMGSKDRDFLMDAALGGLMEVELGRLAAQQGASDAIKQFGQRMVDDHSKANEELKTLATSKGITLPTAIDDKQRQQVTKLSAMSGADFDRAYAKMMLKDHEKDVSEFEKQSMKGTDPDVKAFAGKTLPTLQEHLTMVKALPGNNKGAGNSNSGGSKNSNRNSNGNSNSNSNSNSNRP